MRLTVVSDEDGVPLLESCRFCSNATTDDDVILVVVVAFPVPAKEEREEEEEAAVSLKFNTPVTVPLHANANSFATPNPPPRSPFLRNHSSANHNPQIKNRVSQSGELRVQVMLMSAQGAADWCSRAGAGEWKGDGARKARRAIVLR